MTRPYRLNDYGIARANVMLSDFIAQFEPQFYDCPACGYTHREDVACVAPQRPQERPEPPEPEWLIAEDAPHHATPPAQQFSGVELD